MHNAVKNLQKAPNMSILVLCFTKTANSIHILVIVDISTSYALMISFIEYQHGWSKCLNIRYVLEKVREKSRECHNHKTQPLTKRKRKPTISNKHKSNKRTKRTKISSLFPKRGNRNAKRTEKHKNKMT